MRLNKKTLAVLAAAFGCSAPAFALDEIYSPNAEQELSFEYVGSRTFDSESSKNNAQEHETVIEYGITDRIMVELAGSLAREAGQDQHTSYDGTEIQGRFQFTERGQYWVDSGLLAAYHFGSHTHDPNAVELKLLLEKDTGPLTHKANIGFEQTTGKYSRHTGGPDYVFLWSSRWRLSQWFEPGFELQSDFGQPHTLDRYDDQEHYIGPAVYGRLFDRVHYEAAWLAGVSKTAADSAARILIEYELPF